MVVMSALNLVTFSYFVVVGIKKREGAQVMAMNCISDLVVMWFAGFSSNCG